MNFRELFYGRNLKIIIAVAVILLLTLNKGFRTLVIRNIELYKMKAEIAKIQLENARLRREIYLLENNDAYIDYRIRRDLGYIKEGEIEYRYQSDKKSK
ncbi:MAG: hypothetical protein A2297_07095 [Elusimicrobia bacterium RIFOXYB2_FULL_48_7]|nr:MAG: hypothetical protein A2297_07095 [Elusimicrobia bacterium RIFOXYB2_FULL_48_7]